MIDIYVHYFYDDKKEHRRFLLNAVQLKCSDNRKSDLLKKWHHYNSFSVTIVRFKTVIFKENASSLTHVWLIIYLIKYALIFSKMAANRISKSFNYLNI